MLNLGFNIKNNIFLFFIFFIFPLNGNKIIQNPTTFFSNVETEHAISKTRLVYSSIRLSKIVVIFISFVNFKLLDVAKFNASFNNQ